MSRLVPIAIASLIISLALSASAVADDHHHGDNRGDEHHHRDRHEGHDDYQRYPVYAPRPVYVDPRPSIGINLFVPFVIR